MAFTGVESGNSVAPVTAMPTLQKLGGELPRTTYHGRWVPVTSEAIHTSSIHRPSCLKLGDIGAHANAI